MKILLILLTVFTDSCHFSSLCSPTRITVEDLLVSNLKPMGTKIYPDIPWLISNDTYLPFQRFPFN